MFLHEYLVAFICLIAFVGSVWSNGSKGKGKFVKNVLYNLGEKCQDN